jgi:hypothetical protein
MNRRRFLAALGVVATQRKITRFNLDSVDEDPAGDLPVITTTRYPYVQNVSNDRASILWTTAEPGTGWVRYSSDGVNFRMVVATSRFFSRLDTGLSTNYVQYQADLTGLSPNTDYRYSVNVAGQEIPARGETRFRTAGPGSFNFIVLGDSGWGAQSDAQAAIALKIAAEKPALVVHTGDLVYPVGSYEYYERNYFNYYGGTMSSVPFFPAPGNHDYDLPNATPYLAVHSVPTESVPAVDRGRYYSYDWGNVHFVSIDAHQCLERAIRADGAMLRWLDNDLQSTQQFWRIVYFHYPPYATGQNVNDPQCSWVRQYLVPILENNGVQLVFNGHEHSYQRSLPIRKSNFVASDVGTNYFVSGGGGAILYSVPDRPMVAFAKSAYHYLRAEVDGTRITIRSISHEGVELDNCTIAPSPVFSDDSKVPPVAMDPGPVAGAMIQIVGRGLAAAETSSTTTSSSNMGGTVVTINDRPIDLLYVSPTQIRAQLPFAIDGNVTIRVTTANGYAERSV